LKKFIVHKDCIIDVYLNCVPFGFRLNYHTTMNNRFQNYACVIDNLAIID